jgi:hypothetical protein
MSPGTLPLAGRPNSLAGAAVKRCAVGGAMIGAMVIGGDKFSGKPGDWADVKREIVSAIETAGYSYITKMGAYLFSVAGSGDHGHIEDSDLE